MKKPRRTSRSALDQHQPGVLERWAEGLVEKAILRIDQAPAPNPDTKTVRWHMNAAVIGAFGAGFVFSGALALVEINYFANPFAWHDDFVEHTMIYVVGAIVLTLLEFWCLFRIGLRAIAQLLLAVANALPFAVTTPLMRGQHRSVVQALCRAVLEVEEPKLKPYDLDPTKHVRPESRIALLILYRLKIMMSNFIAKLLIRRLVTRASLRAYAPLVMAPITGLWNAWVMWTVLREAKFRLMGRVVVELVLLSLVERPQPKLRRALMMLVGNRITLFGVYNHNLHLLLTRLHSQFPSAAGKVKQLDDWSVFLGHWQQLDEADQHYLQQVAVLLFALKRERLSRVEIVHLDDLDIDIESVLEVKRYYEEFSIERFERWLSIE